MILAIHKKDNDMIPMLGDTPVGTVSQRMAIFVKRYGSRFSEMRVDKFVEDHHSFENAVELAVLRSVEIDTQFENNPKNST